MYCKGLIRIILFAFSVSNFGSCTSTQDEELNKLKSVTVSLHLDEMLCIESFLKNRFERDSISSDLTFVVYRDTLSCTTCELSHMGMWNSYIRKANAILPVRFYFIFATVSKGFHNIENNISTNRFLQSVYLDRNMVFEKDNPELRNAKYHCFLMDNAGKLLFVGDPTKCRTNEVNLLNVLRYYSIINKE